MYILKKGLLSITLLVLLMKAHAQCKQEEKIITICDITKIDYDKDGIVDGKIDLYKKAGVTNTADNRWESESDEYVNILKDGLLSTWKLKNTTEIADKNAKGKQGYYLFLLFNKTCGDTPIVKLYIQIGPYSGVPTNKNKEAPTDYDAQFCYDGTPSSCSPNVFNLFTALQEVPPVHKNGVWTHVGGSEIETLIPGKGEFKASIPYTPGGEEKDNRRYYDFVYTLKGAAPCAEEVSTKVRVSVFRNASAGKGNRIRVCEDEISTIYKEEIDLRDDKYLIGEDLEGKWEYKIDETKQLTNKDDSKVNLKEVFENYIVKKDNPKFGIKKVSYHYSIESGSNICSNNRATVSFVFVEKIRPFKGKEVTFCVKDKKLKEEIKLYDYLTFTEENGVLYDYPDNTDHNYWELVSPSPKEMEKIDNKWAEEEGKILGSQATVDLSRITSNNQAKEYVFKYTVSTKYNNKYDVLGEVTGYMCDGKEIKDESTYCETEEIAYVKIIIKPIPYVGEDTKELEFCESYFKKPVDLTTLLVKKGKETFEKGGKWTDEEGKEVKNPYLLPAIKDDKKEFNLNYTVLKEGCSATSKLNFIVYKLGKPGINIAKTVCRSEVNFSAYEQLGNDVPKTGQWKLPDGKIIKNYDVTIEPGTFKTGVYTYQTPDLKDAKGKILCKGNTYKLTINFEKIPFAGEDTQTLVCTSQRKVDLKDFIDKKATDKKGVFFTEEGKELSSSIINVENLETKTYKYQYKVSKGKACIGDDAVITINIDEPKAPTAEDQTFCAVEKQPLVSDLKANSNYEYFWFDSKEANEPLSSDTPLKDGKNYFVATKNENDCYSKKVKIRVDFILLNTGKCFICVKDGVSDNNDGINDELGLCNIPAVYPKFEIFIYNRYGVLVYEGNNKTPLFNGEANVSTFSGNNKKLPSGVYYYILHLNDSKNKPIQGDFYLGR